MEAARSSCRITLLQPFLPQPKEKWLSSFMLYSPGFTNPPRARAHTHTQGYQKTFCRHSSVDIFALLRILWPSINMWSTIIPHKQGHARIQSIVHLLSFYRACVQLRLFLCVLYCSCFYRHVWSRCSSCCAGMRILVTLLLDTLPMLGNVLLLCFFVFFIFGIVGVQLWAGLLRNRCFLPVNFSV